MIKGAYKPEFQNIYDILKNQIMSDYELGAAVSIEINGEEVVNLWGGYTSESKDKLWQEDTLVNVWSVTKAVTGACIAKLISDGKLNIEEYVSSYWPEYGNNGKEHTKVIDLLSHELECLDFKMDILLQIGITGINIFLF